MSLNRNANPKNQFLLRNINQYILFYRIYRYDTLWYVAPLPIQKLLLFILKSLKDQHLLIAGMYVASLEGFATVINVSQIFKQKLSLIDIHM